MNPTGRRRTDGSRILLVEDNDELRGLMQAVLETEGYRVQVVRSAEDGLHAMEAGRYDLVLSDHRLPGRSGAWLLRESMVRGVLGDTPALLVTSDHEAPDIEAGTGVIRKPVDFDAFLPQVRAILADGVPLPAAESKGALAVDDGRQASLVLYVSAGSLPSNRALRVMRELLARYDERDIAFETCDVEANPVRAAADRIVFTPTLVRRFPVPKMWVVGNLARPEIVADLLQACGIAPAATAK